MDDRLASLVWDDVRVFLALLDSSSFKEAAPQLGVNPSTVSRRLDALEQTLGMRLFERSRDGIVPTAAAEELAGAARHFARAATAFRIAASSLEREPRGEVTISAPTGVANLLLVPLLGGLIEQYPGLRVNIDTNNAFADLDRHEADLALRGVSGHAPVPGGGNLIATCLARAPLVPVTAPDYAENISPIAELDAVRWVTFGQTVSQNPWARKVLDHVPESAIALRSDDATTVFAAAAAGIGVTWMTRIFADGDSLVEVELAPPLSHLIEDHDALWLVGHRSLRHVPRVAAVWDYLREHLAAPGA